MLDRRVRFGHGAHDKSDTPDTSVDLGVAIRAKHDAAFKLLSDLLPWSIDAVYGARAFLFARVGVVGFHCGGGGLSAARPAPTPKRCERPQPHRAAPRHSPRLSRDSPTGVAGPTGVR